MKYVKINSSLPQLDKMAIEEVASECIKHFENWRNTPNSGIGNGSCCAALKLNNGQYRFGNSRGDGDCATIGVGAFSQNHAEIHLVESLGAEPFQPFIYVDLVPCDNCKRFLQSQIALDYGEMEFYAFYQFDSSEEMQRVHSLDEASQLQFLKNRMGL